MFFLIKKVLCCFIFCWSFFHYSILYANHNHNHKSMMQDLNVPSNANTHMHHTKGWMMGVSLGQMEMTGLRQGTSNINASSILRPVGIYMAAPIDMSMSMLMLNAMYTFNSKTTVMFMLPYTDKWMNMRNMGGVNFRVKSKGIGDLSLNVNHVLYAQANKRIVGGLGLSLPLGSINKKDTTPMGYVLLGYPMQLGSGTYDVSPQLIFEYQSPDNEWQFTTQFKGVFRTSNNNHNYRFGNIESVNVWLTKSINSNLSAIVSLQGEHQANVKGQDPNLNPVMSPTANPLAQERTILVALIGANLYATTRPLQGNKVLVELGKPIYQNLSGQQLKTSWVGKLVWTIAFQ